jgi:dienelactone hydrolase
MRLPIWMVSALFLGCSSAPAPEAPAQKVTEATNVHKDKARSLIDAMTKGRFTEATQDFGDVMKNALPADALAATWKQVEEKYGRWQAIEKVELKSGRGYTSAQATARFERERLVIYVNYDDANKIVGLFIKPPETPWSAPGYAVASAFDEREVQVGSSPALPGTLTVPTSAKGRMPAAVLIHGSGPADRDETVGAIKVFKDLAWGLGSRGVVVLRYVKRSKHSPAGIVTQKEEVLDAAHEAIELLQHTPEVDPNAIFVIGHSQGAYLAPRIAKENAGLAGIVAMAGPTRALQDVVLDQYSYFLNLKPGDAELAKKVEAARAFKRTLDDPSLTADQDVSFPWGGKPLKAAYFLDMRGYDPPAVAKSLESPALILQGERDYQVTMRDYEGWQRGLAGKKNASLRTYASLNHLFASGTGAPNPGEYEQPGHVDEAVVKDIASFVSSVRR